MYLSKIEYIYQLKHIAHGSVSDRFLLFFIVFKKVLLSSFGPEVRVVERIEDNQFLHLLYTSELPFRTSFLYIVAFHILSTTTVPSKSNYIKLMYPHF